MFLWVSESIKCAHCLLEISVDPDALLQHTQSCSMVINRQEGYPCLRCNFVTSSLNAMKNHLFQLTNRRPYECGHSRPWIEPEGERQKLAEISSVTVTPISFPSNHKTFVVIAQDPKLEGVDNNDVQHHIVEQGESVEDAEQSKASVLNEDLFICSACHYSTRFKSNMKRHMKTKHKLKLHQDLHYRTILPKHPESVEEKRTITRERSGWFICKVCNYKTLFSNNYRRHTRQHSNERNFACSECDYCTHSGYLLNSHIRNRHGEKHYPTNISVENLEDIIVNRK